MTLLHFVPQTTQDKYMNFEITDHTHVPPKNSNFFKDYSPKLNNVFVHVRKKMLEILMWKC